MTLHPDALLADLRRAVTTHRVAQAGVAVVLGDEQSTWSLAAGGDAAPADGAFYLASLSKAYTATAVALAAARGALDLDAPLDRHVPELELRWKGQPWQPTLRDALSMRTGLATHGATHFGFAPGLPVSTRLARAREAQADQPPRHAAGYHNIGPIAARVALERATGHGVLEELRQHVPAGLLRGTTDLCRPPAGEHWVRPRITTTDGARPVGLLVGENSLGAGGLFSTVADAAIWLRLNLDPAACGADPPWAHVLRQTHAPQALKAPGSDAPTWPTPWTAYGLGWQVGNLDGLSLLWHTGRVPGAGGCTVLLPRLRFGVTAYVSGPATAAVLLAALALDRVLPGRLDPAAHAARVAPPAPPDEPAPAARALRGAAWQGRFHHAEAGALRIGIEGDGLQARFADCPMFDGALQHGAAPDQATVLLHDAAARLDQEADTGPTLTLGADGASIDHPWLGRFRRLPAA